MSQLIGPPAIWIEVNRSRCNGMFLTCVIPGLNLVQWTRHNVKLSCFAASDTVYSSGRRLQLTSQLRRVTIFVPR